MSAVKYLLQFGVLRALRVLRGWSYDLLCVLSVLCGEKFRLRVSAVKSLLLL